MSEEQRKFNEEVARATQKKVRTADDIFTDYDRKRREEKVRGRERQRIQLAAQKVGQELKAREAQKPQTVERPKITGEIKGIPEEIQAKQERERSKIVKREEGKTPFQKFNAYLLTQKQKSESESAKAKAEGRTRLGRFKKGLKSPAIVGGRPEATPVGAFPTMPSVVSETNDPIVKKYLNRLAVDHPKTAEVLSMMISVYDADGRGHGVERLNDEIKYHNPYFVARKAGIDKYYASALNEEGEGLVYAVMERITEEEDLAKKADRYRRAGIAFGNKRVGL